MYGQIVPVMKSNSQDGFEVSASSILDISEPYRAFDQDIKTAWHSDNYRIGWLKIKFPRPFFIDKIIEYTYQGPSSNEYHATPWTIKSSMDDNTWQELGKFTSSDKSYTKVEVKFEKTKMMYLMVYANCECLNGGESYKEIGGLEIYGYIIGDHSIKTSNKYIGGGI